MLKAKKVFGHVDGTALLGDRPSAGDTAAHETGAQLAMSTMVQHIHDDLIYLVTSCKTPKDLWDTLKGHFERQHLSNKMLLKKMFYTAKMTDDMAIKDHIKYMKELGDKLTAVGAPIPEEDQIILLLNSLTSAYSTLVTALEARVDVDDKLTLNFVHTALLNEELKKSPNSAHSSAPSPCSALMSDASASKKNEGRKSFNCWRCEKPGHMARNCRSTRGGGRRNSRPTHHGKTAQQEEYDDMMFSAVQESTEQVMAASGEQEDVIRWWIDSGATAHMIQDKSMLCKMAILSCSMI